MTSRRISVFLSLHARDYLGEADKILVRTKATDKAIDDLGDEVDDLGRDLSMVAANADHAARAIDDVGDEARGSAVGVALLDREIDKVTRSLLEMRAAAAVPGGGTVGLAERILAGEKDLARLTRLSHAVSGKPPRHSVGGGSWGLGNWDFSSTLAESRGLVIQGLVGLAAVMSPIVAGTLASAVTSVFAGTGAVGGGIVAAIKSERVRQAWTSLGVGLWSSLAPVSRAFEEPVIAAADRMRVAFNRMRLVEILASAAPLVEPLADGLADTVEALGPGLENSFRRGRPAVLALGAGLTDIATGISQMLDDFADVGPEAGMAFRDASRAVAQMVAETGDLFEGLTRVYQLTRSPLLTVTDLFGLKERFGVSAFDLIPWTGLLGVLGDIADRTSDLERKQLAAAASARAWNTQMMISNRVGNEATEWLEKMNDELSDYLSIQLEAADSLVEARSKELTFIEALKEGKGHWELNTEAGLRNRETLIETVKEWQNWRDAQIAAGESVEATNAAYDREILKLRKLAEQAGATRDILLLLNNLTVRFTVEGTLKSVLGMVSSMFFRPSAGRFSYPRAVPGFAAGGTPPIGRPYLVGEHGPEVRVDTVAGQIYPAGQWMRGPSSGGALPPVNLTVQLLDAAGHVTRQALITDALGRGVPQSTVSQVYP